VTSSSPSALPSGPAVDVEPAHPCIRCGRPVAEPSAGLCEECNPLELAQPSATQLHGIAAVGIIGFVVLLALVGRAAISGTGPFSGTIVGVTTANGGLAVTLTVQNAGTKGGATTCEITANDSVGLPGELVQTPPVPAGQSLTFQAVVTSFGPSPTALAADCQSP